MAEKIKVVITIPKYYLEHPQDYWSLDDARDDFMHDVYNTLDFLPTNDEANRIIDSFDRVTSGIKLVPSDDAISRADAKKYLSAPDENGDRVIYESDLDLLPPVISQPKTGKWISIDATHSQCDKCLAVFEIVSTNGEVNFCPNCGADMRESSSESRRFRKERSNITESKREGD